MRELSERSGIGPDVLDSIENGRRRRGVLVDELMVLAHALGTTSSALLPPDSDYFTDEERRELEEAERRRSPARAPDVSALVAELTTRGYDVGFTRDRTGFTASVSGPGGYDFSVVADNPYEALTGAYPGASPLDRYDRGAHLAWWERVRPGAPEWPPHPATEAEALKAIADYTEGKDS
jgi:transcriptional regulator with XRE-family HTH domain